MADNHARVDSGGRYGAARTGRATRPGSARRAGDRWRGRRVAGARLQGRGDHRDVPAGLPGLSFPRVNLGDIGTLVPIAAGLAFIGFAESIRTARAFGERHGEAVDANRELIALGLGNIGAGLLHGFPSSSSQSRTVHTCTRAARDRACWTEASVRCRELNVSRSSAGDSATGLSATRGPARALSRVRATPRRLDPRARSWSAPRADRSDLRRTTRARPAADGANRLLTGER